MPPVEGAIGSTGTGETGGGEGPTGAPSDAAFNRALARMTAAAEKRLDQDARRTETQEIIGAAKQAAARTSA